MHTSSSGQATCGERTNRTDGGAYREPDDLMHVRRGRQRMLDRCLRCARPSPDDPDVHRVSLMRQRRPSTRFALGPMLKRPAAHAGFAKMRPHPSRQTSGASYIRTGGNGLTFRRIEDQTTLVLMKNDLHLALRDVVPATGAHTLLDRLPNEWTLCRATRMGRRATSARNLAVIVRQLILRMDNGDAIKVATSVADLVRSAVSCRSVSPRSADAPA